MLIGWCWFFLESVCLSEFEFYREYFFYNLIDYTVWWCQSIGSVSTCGLDMCARCLFVSLVSLAFLFEADTQKLFLSKAISFCLFVQSDFY